MTRIAQCNRFAIPGRAVLPRRTNFRGAFTLIEVLISVALFAIVLAAINGIFYGGLHLQMNTTVTLEDSLPTDHALDIIKRDIANIVLPTGVIGGKVTSTPSTSAAPSTGAQQSRTGLAQNGQVLLELFTSTGGLSDDEPWGDIQKVDYSLQSERGGNALGKTLVRSVTRNILGTASETPTEQVLLENVQTFQVTFFDGTNWMDTFNTTTEVTNSIVPAAIRLQIVLAASKEDQNQKAPLEILVPVMCSLAVTNQ